jgi:UDP-glucose 4-epimerase
MVLPNFVQRALSGEPLEVHGDGRQTRCFCHVSDVVRALVALMQEPQAYGEVINIGSEEEISITDLAQKIIAETGSHSAIRYLPYESVYGEGFEDMQRRVPAIAKAKQIIDWQPSKSLSEILADIAQDLQRSPLTSQ